MTGSAPSFSKYRPISRLGCGGMAEVYLVVAEGPSHFNKLQVLKVMRSDFPHEERPDFLRMFEHEARLAARLSHPNIVQSHEVGIEDGMPFLAMEYLDGQALGRIRQRDFKAPHSILSLDMWLFVLCEVLEGLEYAHTLRDYDGTPLHIVHRDVSPDNVFVTYSGQIKLVDFGIAKSLESNKTRPGVVKGKVAYMAPEQVRGLEVDNRADLFSVGVMLWEAIAGRVMHTDLSIFAALSRVVSGSVPSIRESVPDVPAELARIVDRALAVDRDDRYPDAASFRHDLAAFVEGRTQVRAKEIGERVARAFTPERAEISAVIRDAMTGGVHNSLAEYFRTMRLLSQPSLRSVLEGDPRAILDAPAPDAPTTPMTLDLQHMLAAPTPLPPPFAAGAQARARSPRGLKWLKVMLIVACAAGLAHTASGKKHAPLPAPVASVETRGTQHAAQVSMERPHTQPGVAELEPSELQSGLSERFREHGSVPLAAAPRSTHKARMTSSRATREHEMYRDLPPAKIVKKRARELDKDDPWAP